MTATSKRLQNEIQHGHYLLEHGAGEVWNWEGVAGKRRWARRVGMLTGHVVVGMKVLEIGCGTGYFTHELARTGAEITAIDISPDLLEQARKEVPDSLVIFRMENAYAMTFPDSSFDTVVGSSVLHHLDVDLALKEFYRVLRPGGSMYFTEPNMLNPQIALQKNIPWLKRKLGDSPDETAFVKWRMASRLAKHGFRETRIRSFDFLHPKTPAFAAAFVEKTGLVVEKIPFVKEVAGSLYISSNKPQ